MASGVFSNSTDTVFLVVYRIWSTATPGSTHKINVTFSITKDTGTTKQTYFQLVTVTASSPTDASSVNKGSFLLCYREIKSFLL